MLARVVSVVYMLVRYFITRFWRWKTVCSIILALLVILALWKIIFEKQPHQPTQPNKKKIKMVRDNNNMKTILYWNRYFNMEHFSFGIGHTPFEETQCPVNNCMLWDKQDGEPDIPYEEFDAVLFHAIDTTDGSELTKPSIRLPSQRYVFFLLESPAMHDISHRHLNGFFNWTFTYRQDSDIYHPYGWISEIPTLDERQFPSATLFLEPKFQNKQEELFKTMPLSNKTKLVAWMVSNCATESKREWYVSELSRHIQIDTYGTCGTLNCNPADCDKMLETTYKFYLAFENALCEDYVTEKLFRTMELNIVPVVFGGANYKRIAPPMSYIDVNDYKTPKDLAEYLLYLDKNPEQYKKYMWWKSYYKAHRTSKQSLCQLCAMLNNPNLPRKVYHNIDSWWNVCQSPNKFFSEKHGMWAVGNIGRYFHSLHF